MNHRSLWTLAGAVALAGTVLAQSSPEEVARRQLESGRSFARQGNYTEALKDFRAVADTHANSSVADNALLEIAKYYIDVAGDMPAAAEAVDVIVKKYATSDSAPEAYVLAGRLALARSRQSTDLDAARANFERVSRLFPTSAMVPAALTLGGETLLFAGRTDDAIASLSRVIAEYPASSSAPEAYLILARALVAQGEPVLAMEELQQVSNRWPGTPAAAEALARTTLLHRLYLRTPNSPAYVASAEAAGPAKLQNVIGLAFTAQHALYFAAESGLGVVLPDTAERPKVLARPRGVFADQAGRLAAFDQGTIHPAVGDPVNVAVPQSNGTPKALSNLQAVAQLSNGEWLVADGDDRNLHRFAAGGAHLGAFAQGRFNQLAVTGADDVAALDRDQRAIVMFDNTGKLTARIPVRAAGYDLQDVEDLAFDAFGHLYVLDRNAVAVFTAHPRPADGAAVTYRLLALFAPAQNDPAGFRRATAFALDPSGAVFLYDERAARVLVYR